ncbi:MAG TPA: hypothetical protein PLY93_08970, partial [Turneriella sp.]|nr:hypothetical protein [Turneriella sp.]
FRKKNAGIEVRSFTSEKNHTLPQLVNQKAARLSSEYTQVRLIEERDSKFKENLHLSVWEIRTRNKVLREETAIVMANEGPVIVSCLIPKADEQQYRTICDNAFYSVVLDASGEAVMPAQKTAKSSVVDFLTRLYFLHVPNNLPSIPPETIFDPPSQQNTVVPPRPIQYDGNYILPNDNPK